jgi:hypothetical protein
LPLLLRLQVSINLSRSHFIDSFAFSALNNLTMDAEGEEDEEGEKAVLQDQSGVSIELFSVAMPQSNFRCSKWGCH